MKLSVNAYKLIPCKAFQNEFMKLEPSEKNITLLSKSYQNIILRKVI